MLITDLIEGGLKEKMLKRVQASGSSGLRFVALRIERCVQAVLRPRHGGRTAGHGRPAFACTPDLFPKLMAAALGGGDLRQWAAACELV